MKLFFPSNLLATALLGVASLLLTPTSSLAQNFHVTVNTTALTTLPNSANAPFSLDFQLNSGATLNNNSAVISNFTFGGGGAPFGSANYFGGASGTLPGAVTLTDTAAFNEFFQSFTAGTILGFDLSLSNIADAGPTPNVFAFSLLDSSTFNIPTTGLGDTLFLVTLNGGALSPEAFSGTGDYAGITVSFAAIPEPSTYGAMIGAAAFVGVLRNRRRNRASVAKATA